jgi:hypothetical protein
VLIIPFSWGSQLGGHLHQHRTTIKLFSGAVAREKTRLLQGKFRMHILYFVFCFALLYFACIIFIKNTKKLVSFIVVFYV